MAPVIVLPLHPLLDSRLVFFYSQTPTLSSGLGLRPAPSISLVPFFPFLLVCVFYPLRALLFSLSFFAPAVHVIPRTVSHLIVFSYRDALLLESLLYITTGRVSGKWLNVSTPSEWLCGACCIQYDDMASTWQNKNKHQVGNTKTKHGVHTSTYEPQIDSQASTQV